MEFLPGTLVRLHSPVAAEGETAAAMTVIEDRGDRVLVEMRDGFEGWKIKPQTVFRKSDLEQVK